MAGVNGYMLPWDRLAQFVIVTSFEWLDWLPGLGGTLIRVMQNSHQRPVLPLLAFMHIGISPLVLLLMWVHVQRVPRQRPAPLRPIIVGLLLALLVLAMFAPVVSQQGPAALERAVHKRRSRLVLAALVALLIERLPARYVWTLAHRGVCCSPCCRGCVDDRCEPEQAGSPENCGSTQDRRATG